MKKTILVLKNEQGSAIVVAMLVLLLLTIIGVAATQNSITELAIVRNDLLFKDQLFNAEGAAMEAAQWIENEPDTTLQNITTIAELSQTDIDLSVPLNLNDATWAMSAIDPDIPDGSPDGIITGYRIVDQTGPVMLMTPITHTYWIYGLHNRTGGINRGQVLLGIGYKKKF
jgi:hypothetical protein